MLKKVCVVAAAAIGLSMIAPAVANASPVEQRNPCGPCQVDEDEEGDGEGEYPTYWDCGGSGGGLLGHHPLAILAGLYIGLGITHVPIWHPQEPCD
ncbi:MAG: hypothetical protein WBA97_36275 [Actinophytocola sp.]|uniref:hypothetical protein n=1 Tax=Actinophytocola sp. TaxID=1872138 RepID=UPI003C75320B